MRILQIAEIAISVVFAVFVITQFAIPLWQGKRVLPLFRREKELEDELRALNQARAKDALRAQKKDKDQ